MRPMLFVPGSLLAAALAASLSAQDQGRPGGKVEVGSRPTYAFRQPLLNGRGARSLADFVGRPTLIEFWGTR